MDGLSLTETKFIRIRMPEIVDSQVTKFKLFLSIEKLTKCDIKNVTCYQDNQEEFSSQKASFSLLQKHLFFIKLKDNFLLNAFLQHKEQEPDKIYSILNYNMPNF
jgi:hypothetical protein